MKISGSILSSSIKASKLVEEFNKTDIDYIHLDIMDGKFVKNKTWTYSEVLKILKNNHKKLDIHLMVSNPIKYIKDYALLNSEYITFHYEINKNIQELITEIKSYGIKVGISIKPKTPVSKIEPFLKEIDLVLVMSVEPGKSGQEFETIILDKIKRLKKTIEEKKLNTVIEVDGGINNSNAPVLKELGVDILASASYIQEGNIEEKINLLR